MTPLIRRKRKKTIGQKKQFYRNVLLKNTLQRQNSDANSQISGNSSIKENRHKLLSHDMGQSVNSTDKYSDRNSNSSSDNSKDSNLKSKNLGHKESLFNNANQKEDDATSVKKAKSKFAGN